MNGNGLSRSHDTSERPDRSWQKNVNAANEFISSRGVGKRVRLIDGTNNDELVGARFVLPAKPNIEYRARKSESDDKMSKTNLHSDTRIT